MRRLLLSVLAFAAPAWLSLVFTSQSAAATGYSITPVFTFNSRNIASSLNASGLVAGDRYPAGVDGHVSGFLWNGMEQSFASYPDDLVEFSLTAVNNTGTITGTGWFDATLFESRAITGSLPTLEDLGIPSSEGSDINDAGQIVGLRVENGHERGFIHEAGTTTTLGTLGGTESRARGVNESGVVIGDASLLGDAVRHAFRTEPPWSTLEDLGTLGGAGSVAYGINGAGVAVGSAQAANGVSFPVVFTGGAVQQLGNDAGRANAINASGVVVGSLNAAGAFRAINGVVQNLNDLIPANSGWVLWVASDVNDAGEIVGWGDQTVGAAVVQRGFILRPVTLSVDELASSQPALRAIPSVTSGPTRLAFGRPLEGAGRLTLYDVTGRFLRLFELEAGATAVSWDGRDESGRQAPIGCIFGRLVTPGVEARTRLFMVR